MPPIGLQPKLLGHTIKHLQLDLAKEGNFLFLFSAQLDLNPEPFSPENHTYCLMVTKNCTSNVGLSRFQNNEHGIFCLQMERFLKKNFNIQVKKACCYSLNS
jgi:hypothetical protein